MEELSTAAGMTSPVDTAVAGTVDTVVAAADILAADTADMAAVGMVDMVLPHHMPEAVAAL